MLHSQFEQHVTAEKIIGDLLPGVTFLTMTLM